MTTGRSRSSRNPRPAVGPRQHRPLARNPPSDVDPRVSPGLEVSGDRRDPEDPGGDREITPARRAREAHTRWRGRPGSAGMSDAMKADEMIDYVLGQVDGAEREQLEQVLRDDGEPAARAERLRQAIYRLSMTGPPSNIPRTWRIGRWSSSPSGGGPGRSPTICRSGSRSAGPISPWPPASSSPACSRCCRPSSGCASG